MTSELWSPADIARFIGRQESTVRGWLRRARSYGVELEPAGRDLTTGAKLYPAEDIRAAAERMPGRGARTDLRDVQEPQCPNTPPNPPPRSDPPGSSAES
ncbi:terminase gpP N-terminus-related DNA-binding protein [Pseudonocardia asaccharolytica]|uniref:Terminase ATPase subunit N-terminal domain-containing protein n=1 Tax=Pseudonocardia asaccharolytica DSM 44247 = NBRC 16224 TaxID=1123024 RepID=A0A511D288_9PSEU|nr:helix-turn-helix domain-containing protein [Pseudonocardia asaccharolytica]GEL18797.1 hypothetical protein PA7_26340 [Pseudonocardia asaccharolytica DSM 44247 = NBRC 16224]